jgi:hypothetical protein
LVRDSSGRRGYLWKNGATPMPAWFKARAIANNSGPEAIRRCFALSSDFFRLPEGLRRYLASNGKLPLEVDDDLLYGDSVPLW